MVNDSRIVTPGTKIMMNHVLNVVSKEKKIMNEVKITFVTFKHTYVHTHIHVCLAILNIRIKINSATVQQCNVH